MKLLLRRSRLATDSAPRADPSPYWKQVPKVNLVSTRRVTFKRTHLVRAFFVLVIVLASVWLQDLYRSRLDIDDSIEVLSSRLRTVQRQVNNANSQITDLRAQIGDIERERGLQDEPYQAVQNERVAWDKALLALLQARADGVEFGTILTDSNAMVELKGSVDDTESMVDFQNRLRSSGGLLELLSFNLSRPGNSGNPSDGEAVKEALQFSATIKVQQPKDEHQP